ncbi:MAG: aspartate-semialdehyde dehydrogenase [Deferribacteraceae bacterium]|jgi:aspartate-semialdehyde dehydrogenase|nr:aspartate-semialdehyde dehydrogenase [Deferribacteraceae bacterium]
MIKKSAYNVAVVGVTGAVGAMFLQILEERTFPINNLIPLASANSVGKKVVFKEKTYQVEELTEDSFKNVDIALFSAGSERSAAFAPCAVKSGAVVIDNSSAFRMDKNVPLVIPEINPLDLPKHNGIIANPNCTTIIMLLPVKPLYDYSKITRIVVSSYQSASGAGAKAMKELIDQAKAFALGEPLVNSVFPHPLLFNLIPHVDSFLENGYTKEEMKMFNETRKILSDDQIAVSATCVRVPVLSSHSEAVTVHSEKKITVDKARQLLSNARGVKLLDSPKERLYPMPINASDQDLAIVGRIREDISDENSLTFWVSGDQLRKGAAVNAVQIAELLIKS